MEITDEIIADALLGAVATITLLLSAAFVIVAGRFRGSTLERLGRRIAALFLVAICGSAPFLDFANIGLLYGLAFWVGVPVVLTRAFDDNGLAFIDGIGGWLMCALPVSFAAFAFLVL